MIVAVVTAIARATDHIARKSTKASAHGHSAEAPAHETAGNAATNGADGRASAGGGPVGAGSECERREHNSIQECFHNGRG